jgi:hypothetical protein
VAGHYDVGVAALLEGRIEDGLPGRASARLGTLENQLFSTNHPGNIKYRNITLKGFDDSSSPSAKTFAGNTLSAQ